MPYGLQGSNYAAGDYYQGDYYQGDPGIFGTIGKALGGIAKFVGGVAPGPAGAILKAAGTALTPSRGGFAGVTSGASSTAPAPGGFPMILPPGPPLDQYGIINIQSGEKGGGGGFKGMPVPMGMRGLHYNKSTYETRGGGTSRWGPSGNLQIHPKGTVLVKSRRMNVGNARALKRAIRRARGFERLARSVMIVHRFKRKSSKGGRKR